MVIAKVLALGVALFGAFVSLPGSAMAAVPVSPVVAGENLLSGQRVEVRPGRLGTVLVFMSARCPCSNSHVEVVKTLASEFKDFAFVAIHSNADEERETSRVYFKNVAFPFTVIRDSGWALADQYKALKTPHAFVLGVDGTIRYKGGVTSSNHAPAADRQFLREALADLSAGRAVKTPEGRALGCAISRSR